MAIECCLALRSLLRLPLRATQGFVEGLITLLDLPIDAPDYTTLSRRSADLSILLENFNVGGDLHVVVDSSGLKVFGEGEWKVRCHGIGKRRTWRKIHIAVDSKSHEIIACALTTNDFHDSQVFNDLIGPDEDISAVYADGAYDTADCYERAGECGARAIIPPRHGACLDRRKNIGDGIAMRNQNILGIWEQGRKKWKKGSGYHQRSLAETGVYRLKAIFGDQLASRKFENQATEAFIRANILNKMTSLGMPRSVKV